MGLRERRRREKASAGSSECGGFSPGPRGAHSGPGTPMWAQSVQSRVHAIFSFHSHFSFLLTPKPGFSPSFSRHQKAPDRRIRINSFKRKGRLVLCAPPPLGQVETMAESGGRGFAPVPLVTPEPRPWQSASHPWHLVTSPQACVSGAPKYFPIFSQGKA